MSAARTVPLPAPDASSPPLAFHRCPCRAPSRGPGVLPPSSPGLALLSFSSSSKLLTSKSHSRVHATRGEASSHQPAGEGHGALSPLSCPTATPVTHWSPGTLPHEKQVCLSATTLKIPGRGPEGTVAPPTYSISGAPGFFGAAVPPPDSRTRSLPSPSSRAHSSSGFSMVLPSAPVTQSSVPPAPPGHGRFPFRTAASPAPKKSQSLISHPTPSAAAQRAPLSFHTPCGGRHRSTQPSTSDSIRRRSEPAGCALAQSGLCPAATPKAQAPLRPSPAFAHTPGAPAPASKLLRKPQFTATRVSRSLALPTTGDHVSSVSTAPAFTHGTAARMRFLDHKAHNPQ